MSLNAHANAFAPPEDPNGRTNLVGLDRAELDAAVEEIGLPKFRARQIWHWVYYRGITEIDAMTTLSKALRAQLAERFTIKRPDAVSDQQSDDGTRKWLLRMPGGQDVEAVHIPEEDRGALCVSSQVGCTLTCRFCHTGTQPLVRNLSTAEILGQVMHTRDALGEWPSGRPDAHFTNIVLMGMGEPLYNYDNVAKAMRIAMDGEGIAISKRRITLSTSGVVPLIERAGHELGVNLAISLHAVTDDLRDQIMPINRKYPLADLLEACRNYPGLSNARRITFEYVLLKGINDSDADARALVKLLDGIPAKINLIPFNAWPGAPYECSTQSRIRRFGDILSQAGYSSPVRTPRGRDILAACGQLKSASERIKPYAHRGAATEKAEA